MVGYVYNLSLLPPPVTIETSDILGISPIATYDSKWNRLTCMTLVDGEMSHLNQPTVRLKKEQKQKGTENQGVRLCNLGYRKRKWHPSAQPSRVSESLSLMSWLACPRTSFHLLNPIRRQFSFSFRLRFPRDLSVPPRLRNAHLQSGAVPSFREQVARSSPVPCFADAVRHPEIGKHIIVRQMDTP